MLTMTRSVCCVSLFLKYMFKLIGKNIITILRVKLRLSGRSNVKHGIMCLSEKKRNLYDKC